MRQRQHASFWGKFLLFVFIIIAVLNFAAQNSSAQDTSKTQATTVTIETTGQPVYKEHFFDNPPRIVLNFAPQVLSSKLNQNIPVNRGMINAIRCNYYSGSAWLKSLTFFLTAKTSYNITAGLNDVSISVVNAPGEAVKTAMADELIIKDYMPKTWGSSQRHEALKAAIKFVRIKRQMLRSLTGATDASVVVERKTDNSVRITAANLTPIQMITTGARVLLNEPVTSAMPAQKYIQAPPLPAAKSSGFTSSAADFAKVSLGLAFISLGVLVVSRAKIKEKIIKPAPVQKETPKNEKKAIEELFLKEEELQKWPEYGHAENKTKTAGDKKDEQLSKEIFNFPSPPSDIAERRRFARADIRNTRGILNRALVGSKTQPFKHIRVNDISKGGLSFQVKSKETTFKAPTIIKLYFTNSTKPVDLWIKVVWEKDDSRGEGKNVGAKFTRVPKDTWDQIMGAFGHRLG